MRLYQRSIVIIQRWGMQCCNSQTQKKLEFAPGLDLVVRGRLGGDLEMREMPIISSLLKGWGHKVPSRYLYIQSRHNYL